MSQVAVDAAFSSVSVWLARALLFICAYYMCIVLPSLALFKHYAQWVFGFDDPGVTDGAFSMLVVSVGVWGWVWFTSRLVSAFFRLQGFVRPLPLGQALAEVSNVVVVLVLLSRTNMGMYGVGLGLMVSFLMALAFNVLLIATRGAAEPSGWGYRRATLAWPALAKVLDLKMLWALAALAVPAAISISADLLLYDACLPLIGRFHHPVIAMDAHLVAMQLAVTQAVFITTPNSIVAGVFVPRHIGKGDKQRAYAAGALACIASISLNAGVSTVMFVMRRRVARVFIGDDPAADELVELLAKIIPVYCVNAVLDSFQSIMQSVLRGLGRQAYILKVQIIASVLGIAASVTLARVFLSGGTLEPLLGVWLGLSVGIAAKVLMHMYGVASSQWDSIIDEAHERNARDEADTGFSKLDESADEEEEPLSPLGGSSGDLQDIVLEEI